MKIISALFCLVLIGCGSQPKSKQSEEAPKVALPAFNMHFVTYGDDAFKNSRERLEKEAKDSGFFKTIRVFEPHMAKQILNPKSIAFMETRKRGGGYWVWKSAIVKSVLDSVPDGDFVAYLDAGSSINPAGFKRLQQYVGLLNSEKDLFAFQMPHPEKCWTKKDLSVVLGALDSSLDSGQIMATIFLVRKTHKSIEFFERLVDAVNLSNFTLLDDTPSTAANDPCFQEHRHDQSMFSLLCKGYEGCVIIKDETWPIEQSYKNGCPFVATRVRG